MKVKREQPTTGGIDGSLGGANISQNNGRLTTNQNYKANNSSTNQNSSNAQTFTPYRPTVPSEKCSDKNWLNLMAKCWSEKPAARPSFEKVKGLLRIVNGNKTIDVIDLILKVSVTSFSR